MSDPWLDLTAKSLVFRESPEEHLPLFSVWLCRQPTGPVGSSDESTTARCHHRPLPEAQPADTLDPPLVVQSASPSVSGNREEEPVLSILARDRRALPQFEDCCFSRILWLGSCHGPFSRGVLQPIFSLRLHPHPSLREYVCS